MYSSFLLLVLGLVFFLVGCSNDHSFKEKETVVSLNYDTDCLDKIGDQFDLYLDGKLSSKELKSAFTCLHDGIEYFKRRVKQEEQGFYKVSEIKNIFNSFFSDSSFTESFYKKIFIFKSEFFGGTSELLSFKDLDTVRSFLRDFESLLRDLSPYIQGLSFDEDSKLDDEQVSFSMNKIKVFLEKWLFYIEKSISEKNIIDVLVELSDDAESTISKAGDSWFKAFDLLRGAKKSSFLLHSEKDKAISKIIETYRLALDSNSAFSSDWLDKRELNLDFQNQMDRVFSYLKRTLGERTWAHADLFDLVKVIDALDFLPEKFSGNLVAQEEILRLVFDKFFPDGISDRKGDLSQENLNYIVEVWSFLKDFINKTKQIENHKGTAYPVVLSGDDPFERLTRSAWPVLVEKETDSLYVTDSTEEVEFSFRSLFHVSWQVTAAKLLIETYAKDPKRAQDLVGLEMFEVRDAYLDLFELLLAVDILDENSRHSWFRIFNEINLFIPSAEPDNYAGLIEATEYLAYLYSGINAGDDISEKVELQCPFYEKSCVEDSFKFNSEDLFTNMPTLSDYFVNQPSKESLTEWFDSFEFIAKLDNNEAPYSSSLIFRGTIANQYVESIFRRFDVDKNDLIDFKDSEFSFGTFKEALKLLPQVKGTVAEDDDEFLFTFFSFFIKEGRLPKFRNGNPASEFWRWKGNVKKCQTDWEKHGPKRCGYKVDRSRILALLAFLTGVEFVEES